MIYVTTWMNLNMLRGLQQRVHTVWFHLYKILEQTVMEKIRGIASGPGWRLTWKKHEENFWGDGNSLYVDRSFGSNSVRTCQN